MKRTERADRREWLLAPLFVLGLLLLFIQIKAPGNLYDEGLVLTNAERIRAGEVPYRDFWTMYGPGYFYALAGLFSLVPPTILAARLFDIALRFLLTLAVYGVARKLTSRWVALIPYAFVTFWLATIRFYSYPAFAAVGALLLAALAFCTYLRQERSRWLFLTGMALGLTALLRLDFGGYGAVGFALAAALLYVRRPAPGEAFGRARLPALIRAEALMAGGALLVAAPAYGALLVAAGFSTVYEAMIVFPATTFREVRRLPVPPLFADFGQMTGGVWHDWLRLYLPLAIYAAATVVALRRLFFRPVPASDRRLEVAVLYVALTVTGLGLVVKATSRYHDLHVVPTSILAAIVATSLLARVPARLGRNAPFRVGLAGLSILLLSGPYVAHFWVIALRGSTSVTACYSDLARAGCVPVSREQEQVVAYLQARSSPGDYVFVGNSRHDVIFVNDLLLTFLADRRSPTRYAELHPGLATTLPVQQAIVRDLEEKRVAWVVTLDVWPSQEPNASAISSGITFLDDAIRAHYRPEAAFGLYQIWARAF